jgi:hypothetical protein
MKFILIVLLFLIINLDSFGQKKELDFRATLTNYLVELGINDTVGATHYFAVLVQTAPSEKINKMIVFYYKEGLIRFLENNSLLSRFNASDLSEFMDDSCKQTKQSLQTTLILPFVLKRVKEVLAPKIEPVFNSSEFENMIKLLRCAQKESGILGKPILVFIEDSTN